MRSNLARKYLLLDSRVVAKTDNAKLALGTVVKEPRQPLLVADKPWERYLDNLYGNVLYDEEERLYRLWYFSGLDSSESNVAYACSVDGIHWEKPELGIIEFAGTRRNNLVMQRAHGAGIFKDPHDPDPARRYKMFYKDWSNRTPEQRIESRLWAKVATSPDGVHWTTDLDTAMPFWSGKQCDTHNNGFWDERRQRYVIITRTWLGSQEDPGSRIVARMESPDFRTWTRPIDTMRELPEEMGHRQPYAMPIFPYGDIYLGLVMMFNTDEGNWTVDCELTWSPNTWHWYRVCPGHSLIPRGPAGSCDFGMVYACNAPIITDEKIQLYYGGFTSHHSAPRVASLCLARMRPDGWAGYMPIDSTRPGMVETTVAASSNLQVTADAPDGLLTVNLVNGQGHVLASSREMTGVLTDHAVEWTDAASVDHAAGAESRLRFTLHNARLYAFSMD